MEYVNVWQPIMFIIVCCGIGLILGAFWMFCIMRKKEEYLEKELDSKNRLLDSYINVYEDDGIETD